MDTGKLGITPFRRVAGAAFLLLFCAAASMYLSAPAWVTATLSEPYPGYVGIFMLAGIVWCFPTVFYPCLFDRLPRWVQRHPRVARRAAARLGVRLPDAPAQKA